MDVTFYTYAADGSGFCTLRNVTGLRSSSVNNSRRWHWLKVIGLPSLHGSDEASLKKLRSNVFSSFYDTRGERPYPVVLENRAYLDTNLLPQSIRDGFLGEGRVATVDAETAMSATMIITPNASDPYNESLWVVTPATENHL